MAICENELAGRIKKLFCLPAPPQPDRVIDPRSEEWEETAPFWGKEWDDLSISMFDQCDQCFSFLGDSNFPYFFGAMMFNSIKAGNYDNNALGMFLSFWHLSEFLTDPENDVIAIQEQVGVNLRRELNRPMIDAIEDFFEARKARVAPGDEDEVDNFLSMLRSDDEP